MSSTKFWGLVLLGLGIALYIPTSRAKIITWAAPMMGPLYHLETEGELIEIASDLEEEELSSRRLPRSGSSFNEWLRNRYVGDASTTDSWGSLYSLKIWPDSFAVVSLGRDRKLNTDDDLVVAKRRIDRRLRR